MGLVGRRIMQFVSLELLLSSGPGHSGRAKIIKIFYVVNDSSQVFFSEITEDQERYYLHPGKRKPGYR